MIRIGIVGYGNLGRGVESAITQCEDMKLTQIFTRRSPENLKIKTENCDVISYEKILNFKDKIDVIINCGGSSDDLPITTPELAKNFNVVDSYDNHKEIPTHFKNVDFSARKGDRLSLISAGWDPGLFSLARLYMNAVLPVGSDYTFWGRGVSQGHSNALREIDGVADAVEYTIPVESALKKVQNGECPDFSDREKHIRECFVALKDDRDKEKIEKTIKAHKYFKDYDTTVNFISLKNLKENHSTMPHGGWVIRNGKTADGSAHTMEFRLSLESNPQFTGSVLVSCARAVHKLFQKNQRGCITLFDVP
ncbi:MAG: diaminopimelate dehydrogenase, partial [Clostridia bacterium]|nr:diaminopimelate dehydrogenase [Clostridia bacterium]